jgi:hypothetical protein
MEIQILYDHFKDTFEIQKSNIQKRNYLTIICLCLIALLSFQISNPNETTEISAELIKKNIGNIKIDFKYINNILTFSLLWTVITYYQINLQIEKLFNYIHTIEEKLSKDLKLPEFSREGKSYLSNYPFLLTFVDTIYKLGFPLALIFVSIIKFITEMKQYNEPFKNGHFWFDIIIIFSIIIVSLLYLCNVYFKNFRKKRRMNNS